MDKASVKYYRDILADMPIADAHTHISSEEVFHNVPMNFLNIIAYCIPDLISAGMPDSKVHNVTAEAQELKVSYGEVLLGSEPNLTSEEKWEDIKPYWPYVRNIGSGICARKTLQRFFGVDDLTDETIPIIDAKFPELQKLSYKEIYDSVKVDKIIGVSMGGSRKNPSTELIAQQLYSDTVTQPTNRDPIIYLESVTGISIYSLDTYVKALDQYIDDELKAGMVGFKWHITSFLRSNGFDIVDKHDAELALDKILTSPLKGSLFSSLGHSYDEMKPLHCYLQNHLVQKAAEYHVPIQIHSGTFGGTNGNKLQNSKASLLSSMFMRYPTVKFDILHSSWPYYDELAEIVRQFPNVYLNTTWMQTLSPMAFKRYMKELANFVPCNKIFAFGCDEFNALNSAACADIYRDLMAEVMAELVDEGRLNEKEVLFYAKRVSHDNVYDYWNLK